MQLEFKLGSEYRRPALLGVAVIVAAAVAYWWFAAPVETTPIAQDVVTVTADRNSSTGVLVHVIGGVRRPGVVRLPPGSRVIDAIDAAGGIRSGTAVTINLARTVVDGEQIVVGGPAVQPANGRISINSSPASELEDLPGVGPVLAERIVDYRTTHGPFRVLRDLLNVPGIGDSKYAELANAATI